MSFPRKTRIFLAPLFLLPHSFLLSCTSKLFNSQSWAVVLCIYHSFLLVWTNNGYNFQYLHTIDFICSTSLEIKVCSSVWKIGNTIGSKGLFISQSILRSGTISWMWGLVEEECNGGYAIEGNIDSPSFPLIFFILAPWNDQLPPLYILAALMSFFKIDLKAIKQKRERAGTLEIIIQDLYFIIFNSLSETCCSNDKTTKSSIHILISRNLKSTKFFKAKVRLRKGSHKAAKRK